MAPDKRSESVAVRTVRRWMPGLARSLHLSRAEALMRDANDNFARLYREGPDLLGGITGEAHSGMVPADLRID